MDEDQIQVSAADAIQYTFDSFSWFGGSLLIRSNLASDVQFASINTRFSDNLFYLPLISIHRGSIKMSITVL